MVSRKHREDIPQSKRPSSRELFCPTRNHRERLRLRWVRLCLSVGHRVNRARHLLLEELWTHNTCMIITALRVCPHSAPDTDITVFLAEGRIPFCVKHQLAKACRTSSQLQGQKAGNGKSSCFAKLGGQTGHLGLSVRERAQAFLLGGFH